MIGGNMPMPRINTSQSFMKSRVANMYTPGQQMPGGLPQAGISGAGRDPTNRASAQATQPGISGIGTGLPNGVSRSPGPQTSDQVPSMGLPDRPTTWAPSGLNMGAQQPGIHSSYEAPDPYRVASQGPYYTTGHDPTPGGYAGPQGWGVGPNHPDDFTNRMNQATAFANRYRGLGVYDPNSPLGGSAQAPTPGAPGAVNGGAPEGPRYSNLPAAGGGQQQPAQGGQQASSDSSQRLIPDGQGGWMINPNFVEPQQGVRSPSQGQAQQPAYGTSSSALNSGGGPGSGGTEVGPVHDKSGQRVDPTTGRPIIWNGHAWVDAGASGNSSGSTTDNTAGYSQHRSYDTQAGTTPTGTLEAPAQSSNPQPDQNPEWLKYIQQEMNQPLPQFDENAVNKLNATNDAMAASEGAQQLEAALSASARGRMGPGFQAGLTAQTQQKNTLAQAQRDQQTSYQAHMQNFQAQMSQYQQRSEALGMAAQFAKSDADRAALAAIQKQLMEQQANLQKQIIQYQHEVGGGVTDKDWLQTLGGGVGSLGGAALGALAL